MTGLRVGLRCDAGPHRGVGHLVRCLALGEEFLARGAHVELLGSVDGVGWAARQLAARGIPHHPGPDTPAGLVAVAREHRLDVLVLDSYELDPACAGAVRAAGIHALAVVDGHTRGQDADLYLDQNLGAATVAPADRLLAGTRYALLRREVLARRPAAPRPAAPVARPRVLAFFGGTDAFGAAPPLTRLLLATGRPMELTVVVAREALEADLAALRPARGQHLRLVPPTDTLPELIAAADLVVSAAGTSTWELCCLGAPSALVCVVDNQRESYHRVIREGVAAGLGELPALVAAGPDGHAVRAVAVRTLRELLASADRRAALSARGWSTVDGQGRARVVDAVLAQLGAAAR
ncbi:Spore coat polysaccharide biosynthesis protein SpsG, predicted glycosyltransferase [Micromonospora viridifaciens]|uniref:Spore coat polysaccharide biosynthesis protein SpsG, predicted glycosyltransferase n=1 Tax=Micromonospora viridifaciens TaxID=1881 RepID=A0A1C4Z6X7_MICVI|nr:spore coat protein [Micromonospora viridifaciens]SCF28634.1 Spore coat polysaccharide biosynthesis protein SpsG, predicted glycosyltransferase [Micromonospora viridifaciens]